MLSAISLAGALAAFSAGYLMPRRSGWAAVFLVPLLGPPSFTFVPSSLLPLTTYRVGFAIALGVACSRYSRSSPLRISGVPYARLLVIFASFITLVSIEDRLVYTVSTYLPRLALGAILCFYLIRTRNDLNRLVRVLVWQAAIVGGIAVVEFTTGFSVGTVLRSTLPADSIEGLSGLVNIVERSGFRRTAGLDADPVQTGYRLAFLFPLTLWYAGRKRLIGFVPVGLVAAGLMLVQTRAAFLATAIGLLALLSFQLVISGGLGKVLQSIKHFTWATVSLGVAAVLASIFVPGVYAVLEAFVRNSLAPTLAGEPDQVLGKLSRIPVALDYFLQQPFLGYGSPHHVYFDLMQTRDLPGPLIYLLSGGIGLGLVYLFVLAMLPLSTVRLVSRWNLVKKMDRLLVLYSAAAFVAGVTVVFSNPQEDHFVIMFMLYFGMQRVYREERMWFTRTR